MSEGNFEAKVSAKRETNAGIFLTLQIQPDDYKSELATLRVGSALMMGWAEVLNTKVEPLEPYQPMPPAVTLTTTKERKPFDTLPLSSQAAILCNDINFREWLKDTYHDSAIDGPEEAAEVVRKACGVQSRADLNIIPDAAQAWGAIVTSYRASETDRRYAEMRR